MNHLSDFCRICFIFIPSFLILISLSGSSLYWGWTRYDQCSCEPLLPQSLMGFGLLSSMSLIVALIFIVISFFKTDDLGTHLWYLLYAMIAVVINILSITISAFHVTYLLYTKSNDINTFCHQSLYNFSFGFVIIAFSSISLFLLCLLQYYGRRIYKLHLKNQSNHNR